MTTAPTTKVATCPNPKLTSKRAWPLEKRQALALGRVVQIQDHDDNYITDIPFRLFKAASAQPGLVTNSKISKIVVPEHVSHNGVIDLVARMKMFTTTADDIVAMNDTTRDLELCAAAEALGMDEYTQNLFNVYFARVNSKIPDAKNINAITAAHTPCGNSLFNRMAYHISDKLWNDDFPMSEAFQQHYLPTNPRLSDAINAWFAQWEAEALRRAQREERHHQREERRRQKKEYEQRAIERQDRLEKDRKDKNAQVQAALKDQGEKEAKVKASMLEKKRTGQKMNAAEARAHYKTFSKHVSI